MRGAKERGKRHRRIAGNHFQGAAERVRLSRAAEADDRHRDVEGKHVPGKETISLAQQVRAKTSASTSGEESLLRSREIISQRLEAGLGKEQRSMGDDPDLRLQGNDLPKLLLDIRVTS